MEYILTIVEEILRIPFIKNHFVIVPLSIIIYLFTLIYICAKLYRKKNYGWFTIISVATLSQLAFILIFAINLGHK
jgi:hypothetical protein